MPRTVQLALITFSMAFACEAWVEISLIQSMSLSWTGYLAICVSLVANPIALVFAAKARKWAYDLIKWIGALSLVWTVSGGPYLYGLGVWAIALIALCAWLRVATILMLRRKAATEWIEAATGDGFLL